MLARFNVANYKSFSYREDLPEADFDTNQIAEEFSMIPGRMRTQTDHLYTGKLGNFLKVGMIYGANASGKSNLIKAAAFVKSIVLNGRPVGNASDCFRNEDMEKEKLFIDAPSYFEMEIEVNSKRYTYGIEVILSQGRFISEWLVELISESREQVLFSRDLNDPNNSEIYLNYHNERLKNSLKVYFEDAKEDDQCLFLTAMNQNKRQFYQKFPEAAPYQDVYLWFQNSLEIIFPSDRAEFNFFQSSENILNIMNVLKACDTGIQDYKLVQIDESTMFSGIPEPVKRLIQADLEQAVSSVRKQKALTGKETVGQFCLQSKDILRFAEYDSTGVQKYTKLCFKHKYSDQLYDLAEESDGTKRLMELMGVLYQNKGKTYFIDELDRCLHPKLTRFFVEEFLSLTHGKDVQLIASTHDPLLMEHNLLRRDEIWLLQRRKNGSSHIYSLEEFNVRNDQKLDKAYLDGRFGGVAFFEEITLMEDDNAPAASA